MKLSDYINKLKEIQEKFGDLEVIYASDDEGNYFNKVKVDPTPCSYYGGEDICFEQDYGEDCGEFEPNAVCVN